MNPLLDTPIPGHDVTRVYFLPLPGPGCCHIHWRRTVHQTLRWHYRECRCGERSVRKRFPPFRSHDSDAIDVEWLQGDHPTPRNFTKICVETVTDSLICRGKQFVTRTYQRRETTP